MVFTKVEFMKFISYQKEVFEKVRLIDTSLTKQYIISDENEIIEYPFKCHAIWNKSSKCENCISSKALSTKSKLTKVEFVESDIFFIIAIYVEIDTIQYIMEMVTKIDNDTLFDAEGDNKFIDVIETHNERLYTDALTGIYNRRYLEEQIKGLKSINGIAMIDIDDFKDINDTYGHRSGDFVLARIGECLLSEMGEKHRAIRYGGDEFLLVFRDITKDKLSRILENIKNVVSNISSNEYLDLKISVSIGAIYSTENAINVIDYADKALYEAKKVEENIIIKAVK